ncbi:MAG: arylesterase [Candidatus Omnitrophica bacterium]|nr:arylesterase [Candidatus Omnitrophota bacterium]
MNSKIRLLIALGMAGGLLAGCSFPPDVANLDSAGSAIICFGDSLTEGVGASAGHDYPSLLAKTLGREVINAGVAGETTDMGLRRLEGDVLSRDPLLVIVEFGGNDFLHGVRKEEVFAHLDEMVRRIQEKGAMVVLVGVQPGLVGDAYRADYARLAGSRRAAFIPNILEGLLTEPDLMSDTLHPNDRGYERIAYRIFNVVKPLLERAGKGNRKGNGA